MLRRRSMGSAHGKGNLCPPNSKADERQDCYHFKPFKPVSENQKSRSILRKTPPSKSSLWHGVKPKPRSGHRIVCDDVNMYLFGGYNPSLTPADMIDVNTDGSWSESNKLFKELWKFNISTGLWKKESVQDIPDILASNSVLLSGRVLMVFGGTGMPFGMNCSKDLFICDLGSEQNGLKFNLVSTVGNCPPPQYGQAVALVDNFLYTIGGTTGYEFSSDVHRLNLKDGSWEAMYICRGIFKEPAGRYRHEIALYGNKIYVLGGGTATESFGFESIFAFDLSTNAWEEICTKPDTSSREVFPPARRCHSSVQFERYAYILGGLNNAIPFNDFWRIDLATFQWQKLKGFNLPRGVYFHSSCITPSGKLLTFGGITSEDARTAAMHSAWLCVPKLSELCWEALLFYMPDIYSSNKNKLLSLGLPKKFVDRLDVMEWNDAATSS